ncbi:hypothetical protein [Methylocystis echinoides]|uniref:hypothetical protein n=1 Tax=Methylocystis echinoides TaxID=29468 RepID=UPI00341BEC73
MGEVVAFQMRERSPRRPSEPPIGDAQILFFLGVRYMRAEDLPTHAPDQGPRGGRKRKSRARA